MMAVVGIFALLYGAALLWGSVTAIRVLSGLVMPQRPAHFVYLRQASIWSVGVVTALAALALMGQALVTLPQ